MELLEALSAEVRRITRCLYAPSLKRLYDILRCEDLPLLAWGRVNGCEINPLAEAVLEGLELWPFALDVLRLLSQIPTFRSAVLQQKPILLDTLLRKAIESESGHEKYAPICTALLYVPLNITVPATTSTFLSQLLEKAALGSSHETIKPVYQIFSSLSSSDLDALPTNILLQLQESLITVLTISNIDEISTSLFSLAVLSRLASWPTPCPTLESSAGVSDGVESIIFGTLRPAREFFSAKRVHKTLDLVVLKAIMLCSHSCVLNSEGVIEGLKLCMEILQAIDIRERLSWVAKDSGKMEKLYKKILRSDINNKTQWAALHCLTFLFVGQSPPRKVLDSVERLMLESRCLSLDYDALEIFMTLLEDVSIGKIFRSLLEQICVFAYKNTNLIELDNARLITEYFAAKIATSSVLARAISRAMSSEEGQALLHRFVALAERPAPDPEIKSIQMCICESPDSYQWLRQNITVVLLSSALRCSGEDQEAFRLILLPLVQVGGKIIAVPCSRQLVRAREASVPLLETRSTPQTISISHGWKDNIVKEISRDAHYRSESILRMVGDICRDLEHRCEDTERPLREEQSRSHNLETNLRASETRIRKFEADNKNSRFQMQELEHEKEKLLEKVQSSDNRLQYLYSNLDGIQKEFQNAKADAEKAAETAAEAVRQQHLAYLATLTGKDEIYEEQAMKLAASQCRVEHLENDLKQLQVKETEVAKKLLVDNQVKEVLENTLSELESQIELRDEKIERLIKSETSLLARIENDLQKTKEVIKEKDDVVTTLKLKIQTAEAETVRTGEKHRDEIVQMAAAASGHDKQVQLKFDNLVAELRQICSEATRNLEIRDATIIELENKVATLQRQREAHEHEFAEAQDLSSKLMAVVGTKRPPGFVVPAKKTRTVALDGGDSAADYGLQEVNDARNDSAASPASNRHPDSRTLKRAKIRRSTSSLYMPSSKSPSFRTSHRQRNTLEASRPPPIPLAALVLTPNRKSMALRQSEVPDKITSKSIGETKDQRLGSDEFFSDSDIFTSTNQRQLLTLHEDIQHLSHDGTTADF